MRVRFCLVGLVLILIPLLNATAATKKTVHVRTVKRHTARDRVSPTISRDPYIGAIVVDATGNRVLFADNADSIAYPASIVKLMDLLVILEKVRQGTVRLNDPVTITAAATKIGGSQVYLKERETFSVDELLYALMVKSANDAATALAIYVAGSSDAFVELMNGKARELGMTSTRFHSVHGLPPARGQAYDEATARDLTLLARAVLNYPEALRYTSAKYCTLRNGAFKMGNHNHLLGVVEGCDGLKTGYFAKAGFSIIATAERNNERLIAVVLGSRSRQTRDRKARELLAEGFLMLPPPPAPAAIKATTKQVVTEQMTPSLTGDLPWDHLFMVGGGISGGIGIAFLILGMRKYRGEKKQSPF